MTDINSIDQRAYRDPTRHFSRYATVRDQIVFLYDEFVGSAFNSSMWTLQDVSAAGAPTCEITSALGGGQLVVTCAVTSEVETIGVDFNNKRSINLKKRAFFEARVQVGTAAITTSERCYWGMIGDGLTSGGADPSTLTEGAVFHLDASMNIEVQTDDTTTVVSADTGVDAVADVFDTYQIDFAKLDDVRFYINGSRVLTGTTVDMSQLTDAEAMMQPTFIVGKAAVATTPQIRVDYIKIWQDR